jgi:lysyl-tRNA synthetase, class II
MEENKELNDLRKMGVEPYAHRFDRTHSISQVIEKYSGMNAGEKIEDVKISVAGRIRSKRQHGKLSFVHIEDFTGRIQIFVASNNVSELDYTILQKLIAGDIIGVEGGLIKTVKGELSILAKKITLLTKALTPLPSEWFGLKDEELRYRKRYLDILLNPDVKNTIVKKHLFWKAMRDFMLSKDFIEVYTPVLENMPGGADAKPFITHHNALDIDVYLRICCGELWQKRLLVGGFEKTFEIGRVFRNEGMGLEHGNDYNLMEFYWAYADYNDSMKLVQEMYRYVAEKTIGTLKFQVHDFEVDLGKEWEIYDYTETIKKHTGIDISKTSLNECLSKLEELNVEYDKKTINMERAIDNLWKYCRKKICGPGFLINHPVMISPLAKKKTDNPNLVERYQVIIAGTEQGNGYSELNDPIDQRERFEEQAKLREKGDEEAQMNDKDFVEALEYGMPPATGFGVSDRLFSMLMNNTFRECTTFPLLRPEKNQ